MHFVSLILVEKTVGSFFSHHLMSVPFVFLSICCLILDISKIIFSVNRTR